MRYPSGKAVTKTDRIEARERLKEWLKDGDTLWFILRNRSTSGMRRVYDVKELNVTPSGGIAVSTLSWNICLACNFSFNENYGGVVINGCGFSGEQEIADTVGRLLGVKLRYETL